MIKIVSRVAGVVALSFVAIIANAQTGHTDPPDVPDPGTVTGSTYTNKYFGLSITVPSGWQVQDSAYKKRLSEKGKEVVTSDNQATRSELEKAVDNVINLLSVTQYPPGTAGVLNSSFICGAEKVSELKTDADYMVAIKNTLPYSQVPQTITRDVYIEKIGGVSFSVIDFKSERSGVTVYEKYSAHLVNGYFLFFIGIYGNDEQLKVQNQILASITLR